MGGCTSTTSASTAAAGSSSSEKKGESGQRLSNMEAGPGPSPQQAPPASSQPSPEPKSVEKGALTLRKSSTESTPKPKEEDAPDPAARKEEVYRKAFLKYDDDNSGEIDAQELKVIFAELGWDNSDEAIVDALKILDEDDNGTIEVEEFMEWSKMARKKLDRGDFGDDGTGSKRKPRRGSTILPSLGEQSAKTAAEAAAAKAMATSVALVAAVAPAAAAPVAPAPAPAAPAPAEPVPAAVAVAPAQ